MNRLATGWFSELSPLWPEQCFSMKVKNVLHEEKSKYQHILVLDSEVYGRVLTLDGVIQCTEKDEFSYQEMISFLPLACHPNPRKVAIIGGGDGGVAREVCKDGRVESVDLCEIDECVVNVSRRFLPSMAVGMQSDRVRLVHEDGAKFLADTPPDTYDVVIADSSDPQGPAESLFQGSFYASLCRVLKPGGIVSLQGESMWLHVDIIKQSVARLRRQFPVVGYASAYIPTYPGGQIGFLLASKDPACVLSEPRGWEMTEEEMEKMDLKYYSPAMHRCAFVLPRNLEKRLAIENDEGQASG